MRFPRRRLMVEAVPGTWNGHPLFLRHAPRKLIAAIDGETGERLHGKTDDDNPEALYLDPPQKYPKHGTHGRFVTVVYET